MRAAIYARVSRGNDQDVEKQIAMLKDYCFRMSYTIVNEYKDEISGMTESRPAFTRLLEDMRRNKFDVIIVTKLDRFGRSLKHLLSLFEELKKRGVHFIASTQNIDTTTAAGNLQMQILGAFAEFERNIISERTKEALSRVEGVGKRGKDKKPRKRRGVLKKRWSYE